MKIHSGHILLALARRFDWFVTRMMTEFEVDGGRADVVFITKARQLTEIEIKISRADWNADSTKAKWGRPRPHVSRFYYAVPAGLAQRIPEWVPESCGIIAVHLNEWGVPHSTLVRSAKRKRALPISPERMNQLHEAAYYRFWRREVNLLHERYGRATPAAMKVAA